MSEKILDNTTLAAERHARESVKYRDWQPIESAPKDGTEFIGYSAGARLWMDQWVAYVCRFKNGLWIAVGEGVVNPTHWMPLPEPPTDK